MKLISSLDDIPVFNEHKVNIKNKIELLKKINKIIEGGYDQLQLVIDFDHTLTRHKMHDGGIVLTSHGMFRACSSVPQSVRDKNNTLTAIYKPIENNPNMSNEEKARHMTEWYKASQANLKGLKFPRHELSDIAKGMVKHFRKGVTTLIPYCAMQQVPILVFSAGLGDSVVAALTHADCLLPNVKVVSNFFALENDDIVIGTKGDMIHPYNKNETVIRNTDYYDMIKNRCNVLLMGDNIGDADMAEGMEHSDVILKIGYLEVNIEENLPNYLNKFDIVLINDPTVDVASAILELCNNRI